MSNNKLLDFSLSSRQQGFTLLEVLIAILVLSVGLLGLAALQINALQSVRASYQASIANLAAKDVRERLWASLLRSDVYESQEEIITCPSLSESDVRIGDVKEDAKSVWATADNEILPQMEIDVIYGGECEYLVEIKWKDGTDDRGESNEMISFQYHVGLPGYPVE